MHSPQHKRTDLHCFCIHMLDPPTWWFQLKPKKEAFYWYKQVCDSVINLWINDHLKVKLQSKCVYFLSLFGVQCILNISILYVIVKDTVDLMELQGISQTFFSTCLQHRLLAALILKGALYGGHIPMFLRYAILIYCWTNNHNITYHWLCGSY